MKTLIVLAGAVSVLGLSACQREPEAPEAPAPQASTVTTVDPSGAAPPQPSPNGGDTPIGAAGTEGASPNAAEAATQGDPAHPGTTAPPQ